MANFASLLKEEIARLARKEIRVQVEILKKTSSQRKKDVAALKRQVAKLERQVSLLEGKVLKEKPVLAADESINQVRFTAKGLRSQRKRLGLSAAEYASLVGVTPLSIYNWERGDTRPRQTQLPILAALRKMGKKEAAARLRQLSKTKLGAKPKRAYSKKKNIASAAKTTVKKAKN